MLFNPTNETIVATAGIEGLSIWRLADWTTSQATPLFTERLVSWDRGAVAFSEDGETIAFLVLGSARAEVVRWKNKPPDAAIIPIRFGAESVAVSDGANRIAVGMSDGTVEAYDTHVAETVAHLLVARTPHDAPILQVRIGRNGDITSVSSLLSMTWRVPFDFYVGSGSNITAIAPDAGSVITVGAGPPSPQIAKYQESDLPTYIPTTLPWSVVVIAADRSVWGGMTDGRVLRWKTLAAVSDRSASLVATSAGPITAIAAGPGGAIAWAAGTKLFVRPRHGVTRALRAAPATVRALAFGPHDDTLAAGTELGHVLLWRLNQDRHNPVVSFGRTTLVKAIAISHDGLYIAAAGGAQLANVWPVGDPRRTWTLHADHPSSIAFEPGGDSILIGSVNGIATVISGWRDRPVEVARFINAWDVVQARFSTDGRYVMTVSRFGLGHKRIWNGSILADVTCRRLLPFRGLGELSAYDVTCSNKVRPVASRRLAMTASFAPQDD